jgi:hypothetical protein
MISSRGKCAGSDLSGVLRSRMGDAVRSGNSASAVSSSSSASSSWAISLYLPPPCARRARRPVQSVAQLQGGARIQCRRGERQRCLARKTCIINGHKSQKNQAIQCFFNPQTQGANS